MGLLTIFDIMILLWEMRWNPAMFLPMIFKVRLGMFTQTIAALLSTSIGAASLLKEYLHNPLNLGWFAVVPSPNQTRF